MRIDLYTRCWNDAHMLPFMFRHYDEIVQRYFVYDDGSTDGSLNILRAHRKVEVRDASAYRDPSSKVLSALAIVEACWKESRGRADWVIVTDIDEHLYHRQLAQYLRACKRSGITIIPALGYHMISDELPGQEVRLSDAIVKGAPFGVMSKLNIFSPSDIEATNFEVGRHKASPSGNVVAPTRDELLLLHYKYMGFEATLRRHAQYRPRLGPTDIARGWGYHYAWSPEELSEDWNRLADRLVDISDTDLRPWETHTDDRWWNAFPKTPCILDRGLPRSRRLLGWLTGSRS